MFSVVFFVYLLAFFFFFVCFCGPSSSFNGWFFFFPASVLTVSDSRTFFSFPLTFTHCKKKILKKIRFLNDLV
ncbi:hypothetical protein Hanom_Chr01g00028101 [Helianthus anomalus]